MEERFKLFTVFMTKIRRCVQRIKTEEMAEYNLKSPHVSCLYFLLRHGTMTATELCEICDEDKAAISRSILQLEKEGYVEYTDEQKKRYRAHIRLTPEGRNIAEGITKKVDHVLNTAGDGLSEADRIIFYRSLELISKNLEDICKKYDK